MGLINSLINQYQLNYSSDPLEKCKQPGPYYSGRFDMRRECVVSKLWDYLRLEIWCYTTSNNKTEE